MQIIICKASFCEFNRFGRASFLFSYLFTNENKPNNSKLTVSLTNKEGIEDKVEGEGGRCGRGGRGGRKYSLVFLVFLVSLVSLVSLPPISLPDTQYLVDNTFPQSESAVSQRRLDRALHQNLPRFQ